MNHALDAAPELQAIERQEGVVDYLREQLRDAKSGMSLRSPDEIRHELDAAEAKLKRLRSAKAAGR